MNLLVLILIGIPLAVYLLVLVFSTGNLSPDGTMSEDDAALGHAVPPPVTPAMTVEQSGDTADARAESIPIAQDAITPELSSGHTKESDDSPPGAAATPALVILPEEQPVPDEPATTPTATIVSPDTPTLDKSVGEQAPPSATTEQPSASNPTIELPQAVTKPGESEPILSGEPLILPDKDPPKYVFDYRGRLWVEKKRRGFFRQLRRPQLPPEDPTNNTKR